MTTDTPNSDATHPKPLIIRVRNFIGDVVLATPALMRLQAAGYALNLVGKPWLKSLFEAYPWTVSAYPKSFSERRALLGSLANTLEHQAPSFRKGINAITFATSFSSALDMRAAGLKPFGFGAEARSFLLTRSAKIVYGEHALDSYWRLTSAFLNDAANAPSQATLAISPAAEKRARDTLDAAGVGGGYIVMVPFAGGTFEKLDKKWQGFPELARYLASDSETRASQVVLAPGPDEEQEARARFPQAKFLTRLDLGAYAAVMRDAALTIANDTGPGHMAASVNGRLLSVLGPTKIEQWGARGTHVHIVQSFPQWPSVPDVAAKVRSILLMNR